MTIYKCRHCGFLQNKCSEDFTMCFKCGVNNRLKKYSNSEILADISNTLSQILKLKKELSEEK